MEPFKMHIVELSGSPRQRGRMHGEQMRSQIKALFDQGRAGMEKAGGPSLEAYAALFQRSTGHLQAAQKWTPGLVEELHGIAEGSGENFDILWAFQCQDESFWFTTGQLGKFTSPPDTERCSSLGIAAGNGQPTLLAQNLDTPMLYNGLQTLLHIHYGDSNRQAYVVTEPGLIGICGLNNSPLGVCQNTLAMKLTYDPKGLPAMLVARALIDQPDLDAAVRFLQAIRHASGINYMLADSERVEDYECSRTEVHRFVPADSADRLAHTNHPFVNPDRLDPELFSPDTRRLYDGSNRHSGHRMACLEKHFLHTAAGGTVEEFKQILSSHAPPEFPICRHFQPGLDPMQGMTNNSLIMLLGRPAELHLTSGPPCSSEFVVFRF
jgi:hypothetical protein